jgi:hypothetical protein
MKPKKSRQAGNRPGWTKALAEDGGVNVYADQETGAPKRLDGAIL